MEHKETSFVRDESSGTVREESTVLNEAGTTPVLEASSIKSTTPARRAMEVIYLFFGVIDGLLVIRLALKLLGANPFAGFANLIYGLTDFMLAPFRGLFPNWVSGQSILEPSLLVAILIYSLVALGLVRLVAITLSSKVMVSKHSRSERLKPDSE
jgi:YggT family protein